MVEISQQNTQRQNLLQQLLSQPRNAAGTARQAETRYVPKGREVHDTVELSDGAKLVNLSRGLDLAKDIRNDRDSETLQERLRQGSSDIERIGRLFREVFAGLKSLFGRQA